MEAEEIARLEAELDRRVEECDRLQKKCKSADAKVDVLQRRLAEFEGDSRFPYSTVSSPELSEDVERAFYMSSKSRPSSSRGHRQEKRFDRLQQPDTGSVAYEEQKQGASMQAQVQAQALQTIEMYR